MWLRFTTIQGKKASVQINKRDYAQLLERFSVKGAEQSREIECPFCEKYDMNCDICPLGILGKNYEEFCVPCFDVVPGLERVCGALDDLYMDRGYENVILRQHKNNVRILKNFRRGIVRAARSKKSDTTS